MGRVESSGYDLAAHVSALDRHGVHVDVVLAQRGALPTGGIDVEVVEVEVAAPGRRVHDPAALGAALAAIAG